MCLAKNLKYLRLKNGYSQDYIANMFGYKSYTTIQKWESGDAEPSVTKLRELANLYKISMNELLTKDIEYLDSFPYGDHQANLEYFADKPELLETYRHITENDNLRLLFDSTKDLTPQDLEPVLLLIDGIRRQKGLK